MIIFRTQIAKTVSISRYENRYCSWRQASRISKILGSALGLSASSILQGARYLNGNVAESGFVTNWTGTPAESGVFIDFLLWFSESSDSETFNPKGSFVVLSYSSGCCDQSVVFTTKRFELFNDFLKKLEKEAGEVVYPADVIEKS